MADDELECAVCGATIAKARAIEAGWKAYGPPAEGKDLFDRDAEVSLSIRCNQCALGAVIIATQMDVEGEPLLQEALDHYRSALTRKEWNA